MSTRGISKEKAKKIVNTIKSKKANIVFYTDKISISLSSIEKAEFWKSKFPAGKIRLT